MPAVDYEYNYDRPIRKVNKTASSKSSTNHGNSYHHAPQYTKTRSSTKSQVRMATHMDPKENTIRKSRKANSNLEIPNIKSKKKTNVVTSNQQVRKSSSALKPAEMKLKRPEMSVAQKKKQKQQIVSRIKNVFYLGCAFSIAFFICYRYSLINEKFNQLEKIKKELTSAETVNEQIQADIDSQTDLSYIENYAKYQLGMQKPSNSQIVYVNVEKEDRILTPVTIEEDSNKTWLEKIYEEIVKLFN